MQQRRRGHGGPAARPLRPAAPHARERQPVGARHLTPSARARLLRHVELVPHDDERDVLDIPGAHGKVPVGPNYISQSSNEYSLRDPRGQVHAYTDGCTPPFADET